MSSHHAVPENKKSGIDTPVTTRFSEFSISNVRFCCCSTRIADSDTTATMNRRMEIEMVIITFKSFMYLTFGFTCGLSGAKNIRCDPWFYVIILNFCLFEFYDMLKNFFWNMQLLHEAAHRNYFSNDSNQADLRVCLIQG